MKEAVATAWRSRSIIQGAELLQDVSTQGARVKDKHITPMKKHQAQRDAPSPSSSRRNMKRHRKKGVSTSRRVGCQEQNDTRVQFSPVPIRRSILPCKPQYGHEKTTPTLVPSVVLLQPIRRGIKEIHCHPRPSTEKKGEAKRPRTQTHNKFEQRRPREPKESSGKRSKIHYTNFWTEPVGQACASFSRCVNHANFRP